MQKIKRIMKATPNNLKNCVEYVITDMFDVVHDDGFADIEFIEVDRFSIPWKRIQDHGGIAEVNASIKEHYSID